MDEKKYINKVKTQDGNEFDLQDARVAELEGAIAGKADASAVAELHGDVLDLAQAVAAKPSQEDVSQAKTRIDQATLIIPEQPEPEPVAIIDGVKYFHKKELDVEASIQALRTQEGHINLLTGEISNDYTFTHEADLYRQMYGPRDTDEYLAFALNHTPWGSSQHFVLWANSEGSQQIQANYVSRAFKIADNYSLNDNTEIYLSECTAYYGAFSEDGKTFISYYNLKSEAAPSEINYVKQGNSIIPIKDARLPDNSSSTNFLAGDGDHGFTFVYNEIYTYEEKRKVQAIDQAFSREEKEKLAKLDVIQADKNGILTIDKIQTLDAVAEIDGIKYYHEQVFSFEQMPDSKYYNLISGETIPYADAKYSYIIATGGGSKWVLDVKLAPSIGGRVYSIVSTVPVNYQVNKAYDPVKTKEEVTEDGKIYAPDCTAVYIGLNGSVVTVYYNLESDAPLLIPEPVSKLTDGESEVEIHDARLVATTADVGKVVGVDANGNLALVEAPAGGTKLYRHTLVGTTFYQGHTLHIVSTDSTPVVDANGIRKLAGSSLSIYGLVEGNSYPVKVSYIAAGSSGLLAYHGFSKQPDDSINIDYSYVNISDLTDVVTEL